MKTTFDEKVNMAVNEVLDFQTRMSHGTYIEFLTAVRNRLNKEIEIERKHASEVGQSDDDEE